MRKCVVVAVVLLLATAGASAQNVDIEALSGLQFNFSNPGARALGMGGAFIGLADDASAAESNPAGLTILRTPEFSIEGRNFETIQRLNVTGVYPDIQQENFSAYSDPVEISFASFVYPMGNGVIAGYYHQPLHYEADINALTQEFLGIPFFRDFPIFHQARGNPPGSAGPISEDQCIDLINESGDPFACLQYQINPFVSSVSARLQTAGLSMAYQFGSLSLGVSGRYQTYEQIAMTTRLNIEGNPYITSQVVQATFDGENFVEENDMTFTAGFKWQMAPNFSVGGTYKQGAEFDAPIFIDNQDGFGFQQRSDETKFHIPDLYGFGVSWRPTPVLTINADVVEVKYSNLTDNFTSLYNEASVLGQDAYRTEDGTEIHAGFEYFFTTSIPFAIRGGWWRDPAHGLEYVGPTTCTDEVFAENDRQYCAANRTILSLLFPGSEDQDHLTVGIGLAWPNFQIDAAYDTSDLLKVGSLSAVYRF